MLISSRTVAGKCPVCGAANCACGGPSNVIAIDERGRAAGGDTGPLRRYELGRGAAVLLRDDAARARGLLPAKREEPVHNKRRAGASDKAARPEDDGRPRRVRHTPAEGSE